MTAANDLAAQRAETAAIRRLALPLILGIDDEDARRIVSAEPHADA